MNPKKIDAMMKKNREIVEAAEAAWESIPKIRKDVRHLAVGDVIFNGFPREGVWLEVVAVRHHEDSGGARIDVTHKGETYTMRAQYNDQPFYVRVK